MRLLRPTSSAPCGAFALRLARLSTAVLLAAPLVAGCGGDDPEDDTAAEPDPGAGTSESLVSTAVATPSVEPPEPSSPAYEMPYSASWNYENPQSYTFTMEVRFGAPLSGETAGGAVHPLDSALVVDDVCDFDPQTDAVVFGQLVVTATTEGFDTDIGTAFTVNPLGDDVTTGSHDDGRVGIAQSFADGPECEYLSSENYGVEDARVHWSEPVPSGETRTHEFYAVLHAYYSPSAPEGDTEWLSTHGFTPNFGGSNTSEEERQQIFQPDTSTLEGITFTGNQVG